LCKAIKFVRNEEEGAQAASQEMEALQRVKEVRHPFIRPGTGGGDRRMLVIVMELADQNLYDFTWLP